MTGDMGDSQATNGWPTVIRRLRTRRRASPPAPDVSSSPPWHDALLEELSASTRTGWKTLVNCHGSQSAMAWPLARAAHEGERDRRNIPFLRHVTSVASFAVEDAKQQGATWQALRQGTTAPTHVSTRSLLALSDEEIEADPFLRERKTELEQEIDLKTLSIDEVCAALLLHDRIEHLWDRHIEVAQSEPKSAVDRGTNSNGRPPDESWYFDLDATELPFVEHDAVVQLEQADTPQRPNYLEMERFMAGELRDLYRAGLSPRVLFLVDGMTYLPSHGVNRFEAVLSQAQKLLHPSLRNLKRYDLRHNTEANRLYPYQSALDTVNQLWKYEIMHQVLDVLPDGLESWDDLPDEVLGLPFAADILTNRYEMPVAPKEDPVVRERLSSEQFPVRMSRDLAG